MCNQTNSTKAQQRWLLKLMGYDFTIEYKKGSENSAADALSRRSEGVVLAISMPTPHWVEPIQEEVKNDATLQTLLQNIQKGEAIGPWRIYNAHILQRLYLPPAILSSYPYHNSRVP